MKVMDAFFIKGRGPAVSIDALPAELECGMFVRSGDYRWQVVGIESMLMGRERDNGQPRAIVLRGNAPTPKVGAELEIDREAV